MRKIDWRCWGSMALLLGLSVPATAQLPGLFGTRPTAAKQQPTAGAVKIGAEDYNRLTEILVELAWLADPATFPCLLEAHVDGAALQVKGHVPDHSVRERALQIARLHCPMTVVDGLKERANSAARPARLHPPQLLRAAQSSLQASFPQANHFFQVRCDADGRVRVSGFVGSFEEKLAVSQTLRRLHGCTAALNETHVSSDLHQPANVAKAPAPTPASVGAASTSVQSAQHVAPAGVEQTAHPAGTKDSAGLGEPYVSHGVVLVSDSDVSPADEAAGLQRHISQKCGIPAAKIGITRKPGNVLDIQLAVANQAECDRLSRQIAQLPDLRSYRLQIHLKKAE